MTNRIDEIKARVDKATPGKWKFENCDDDTYFDCHTDADIKEKGGDNYSIIGALGQSSDSYWIRNHGDKELIENAGEDIRYLLNRIAILEKALELSCDCISAMRAHIPQHEESEYWMEQAEKELKNE